MGMTKARTLFAMRMAAVDPGKQLKFTTMARNANNAISGAVGNLVFYTVNGKNYIRTKPGKRKKKRGPKNPLNTVFGAVSTYGSGMIKALKRDFLFPFNLDVYNLSRGWMRNQYAANNDKDSWELQVNPRIMCQLNPATDLREYGELNITVTDRGNGMVSITVPALEPKKEILAPIRTRKINMKIMLVTSPFRETGIRHNVHKEQWVMEYNNSIVPERTIVVDTKIRVGPTAGHIAIVLAALEFETAALGTGQYDTNTRWLPAGIIAMGKLKT